MNKTQRIKEATDKLTWEFAAIDQSIMLTELSGEECWQDAVARNVYLRRGIALKKLPYERSPLVRLIHQLVEVDGVAIQPHPDDPGAVVAKVFVFDDEGAPPSLPALATLNVPDVLALLDAAWELDCLDMFLSQDIAYKAGLIGVFGSVPPGSEQYLPCEEDDLS